MLHAAISGFLLGLSLILAIGAQNAFVLRQGLRREHVFAVCLVCALSDAILIAVGVTGFGAVVEAAPWLSPLMRYAGAAFLFVYGLRSFRAAFNDRSALLPSEQKGEGLWRTVLICLAFTWLNPHVYLDTLVLLGSTAAQYGDFRLVFGLGAMLASFAFFFSLGYGARLLSPVFARPRAWQILDCVIGTVLVCLAFGLVFIKG